MSLLDGLKDSMKNPLTENNDDMSFVLESDFELALEKATDIKLSPEDIRAILNGDDDIDDEDDDLDNPDDDVDKDYTSELEACKEALEATMTELGIDTAGDETSADDDTDDPELDPEGDDEILSEEQLIAECESLIADTPSEDFDEDDEPPADDSAMESPNPGADKNTKVKGIVESDDESDDDDEDESEEDEDSDKHKHHEECEDDDDECEKKHHKHHDHDEDDEDESEDDDEKESDDDDEKKDKKEKEDDDDEDEEAEESTLESILDNLLGVPM